MFDIRFTSTSQISMAKASAGLLSAMLVLFLLVADDSEGLAGLLCTRELSKIEEGRRCRKPCVTNKDCNTRKNQRCLCDDRCGYSCIDIRKECSLPETPQHGTILRGGSLAYGRLIQYQCDRGFVLSGQTTRKCRSDQKWSGNTQICVSVETCGQAGNTEGITSVGKVVGGSAAAEGAWPWQALLLRNRGYRREQIYDPKEGFGGGSVINRRWILTAGHIFDAGIFPRGMRTQIWSDAFLIILGMTKYPEAGQNIPEHVKIFTPSEVIRHEKFDKELLDYDVALIKVGNILSVKEDVLVVDETSTKTEITFSQFIRPVCLNCLNGCAELPVVARCDSKGSLNSRAEQLNADVIATGFGSNVSRSPWSSDFRFPGALQQLKMRIMPDKRCVAALRYINSMFELSSMPVMKYTKRMICAQTREKLGSDTCQGDSGGAVVKKISNADGSTCWVQVGIVSWGAGCGQLDGDGNALPAYYTNVSSVMQWVVAQIQRVATCGSPTDPTNGKAIVEGHKKKDIVKYVCDDGYQLFGKDEGKCSAEGSWGPVPFCMDQSQCGRAGDIGGVNKIPGIGRVVGGDNSIEGAWPWHALITRFDENILMALDNLQGGGSLLNTQWVMTAASIFEHYPKHRRGWWKSVVVSLGINRRPQNFNSLSKDVRIFQPQTVYIHPDFDSDTHDSDIALIKLGGEFVVTKDGKGLQFPTQPTDPLTLTPYIRPICLPCTPNSCTYNVLREIRADGQPLLNGSETPEEACNIENGFLAGKNINGDVTVFGTGFGHMASISYDDWGDTINLETSTTLQQVSLEIQERTYCEKAVALINIDRNIHDTKLVFTDNMLCGIGRNRTVKESDTCKGDGGAPIVRQVHDEVRNESCFVQLGILSWGNGCAQSIMEENKEFFYPGFYTNIQPFLSWLTFTMEINA